MVNVLFGAIVAGTSVLGSQEGLKDTKLGHHIHNGGSWVHKKAKGKPMITLRSRVDLPSYDELGLKRPRVMGDQVRSNFMADTGASVSIAGMSYARELGVREDDLLGSNLAVSSADGSRIGVLGSILVELESLGHCTKEQIYICRGTKGCLLSLEACISLDLVPKSFPEPGAATRSRPKVLRCGAAEDEISGEDKRQDR